MSQSLIPSDPHTIEAIVVGAIVGLGQVLNHFKGKGRDGGVKSLGTRVIAHEKEDAARFTAIQDTLNELRKDIRELRQ